MYQEHPQTCQHHLNPQTSPRNDETASHTLSARGSGTGAQVFKVRASASVVPRHYDDLQKCQNGLLNTTEQASEQPERKVEENLPQRARDELAAPDVVISASLDHSLYLYPSLLQRFYILYIGNDNMATYVKIEQTTLKKDYLENAAGLLRKRGELLEKRGRTTQKTRRNKGANIASYRWTCAYSPSR